MRIKLIQNILILFGNLAIDYPNDHLSLGFNYSDYTFCLVDAYKENSIFLFIEVN